jgi:hypothetical protein
VSISVRNSRQFPAGPISLVALSKKELWPFPVSLRKLCAPEVSKTFNPWSVTAGDVSANGTFTISSRGAWSVTGSAHDSGTLGGDGFLLDLTLDGTPGVGTSFRESLDPDQTMQLTKSGADLFIRDHFSELHSGTTHLDVSPNWLQAIGNVLVQLAKSFGDGDGDGSGNGGSGEEGDDGS